MKQIHLIPVIYQAEVIFPRGRKARTENFYTMVPVEIDTIDINDAPIMALKKWGTQRKDCIRSHNDSMYLPCHGNATDIPVSEPDMIPYDDNPNDIPSQRIHLSKLCQVKRHEPESKVWVNELKINMGNLDDLYMSCDNCYSADEKDIKKVISTNLEAKQKEVRQLFQNYTLIGDSLYQKKAIDYVKIGNKRFAKNLHDDNPEKHKLTVYPYSNYCDSDLFPIPIQFANAILEDEKAVNAYVEVDIIRPELFSFDENDFVQKICQTLDDFFTLDYIFHDRDERMKFMLSKESPMHMIESVIKKTETNEASLDDLLMISDSIVQMFNDPDFFRNNGIMIFKNGMPEFIDKIKNTLQKNENLTKESVFNV